MSPANSVHQSVVSLAHSVRVYNITWPDVVQRPERLQTPLFISLFIASLCRHACRYSTPPCMPLTAERQIYVSGEQIPSKGFAWRHYKYLYEEKLLGVPRLREVTARLLHQLCHVHAIIATHTGCCKEIAQCSHYSDMSLRIETHNITKWLI